MLLQRHRPGKEEGDFQIEHDEHDGDQVVAHVEPHARSLRSLEAALVGETASRVVARLATASRPMTRPSATARPRDPWHDRKIKRQVIRKHCTGRCVHITKSGSKLSQTRDNRPREIRARLYQDKRKVMVPTGRLEPPQIAPLAPQASVSTNSTTSAFEISTCFTASAGRRFRRRARAPRYRVRVDGRAARAAQAPRPAAASLLTGALSSSEVGCARASRWNI